MANIIKKANSLVKTRQSPWTRHYYLLCNLRKTCFGVQLSGFLFRTTSLLIRCHSRDRAEGGARGALAPPHFFARIKINLTKNNLTKKFSFTHSSLAPHSKTCCAVTAIIYPNIDYADSLNLSGIWKLSGRCLKACDKLFNDIVTTPSHNLGHLLPERHVPRYNLRQTRVFVPPRAKTCRFTNTLVPSIVGVYNESWYINYELYFPIDFEI